jgi:hypothetical protein
MNKLYLLALLGLAVKADIGTGESSDGWYAGDCLDEDSFSEWYGYVDFDCGADCGVTDGGDTDVEDEAYW